MSSGNASVLRPRSAATISASQVEWLTAVCFFESAQIGKKVVGPDTAQKTPETLLDVDLSDAKSASVYNHRRSWDESSPTHPYMQVSLVWWI